MTGQKTISIASLVAPRHDTVVPSGKLMYKQLFMVAQYSCFRAILGPARLIIDANNNNARHLLIKSQLDEYFLAYRKSYGKQAR